MIPCHHKWTFVKDWWGDTNVPNGTQDCSFWECVHCGEVWDDPYESPVETFEELDDDTE